jgi:DNA-directed RNA polymerase specialized sigma subunit
MSFLGSPDRLEKQYKDPFDQWKLEATPKTTGNLLRAVSGDIDKGIQAHVGKKSSPMIRSRARQLTIKAFQGYDPTKARLGTHIVNQLEGLKRISRQQSQVLKTPERVSLDQQRVRLTKQDFLDQNGREPSMSELADQTGLAINRLNYIRKFQPAVAEGTLQSMASSEGGEASFLPAINDPNKSDPWVELVYSDLDAVNQKILEWTLGLHGEPVHSNQDIARKLRVSPGAISQRKQHIQSLLDEGEERSIF